MLNSLIGYYTFTSFVQACTLDDVSPGEVYDARCIRG